MITLQMKTQRRVGLLREPISEITKLEWVFFAGKLYSLECLHIKEKLGNLKEFVFNKFGEQFGGGHSGIKKPSLFEKWTIASYCLCRFYGHFNFRTVFENYF